MQRFSQIFSTFVQFVQFVLQFVHRLRHSILSECISAFRVSGVRVPQHLGPCFKIFKGKLWESLDFFSLFSCLKHAVCHFPTCHQAWFARWVLRRRSQQPCGWETSSATQRRSRSLWKDHRGSTDKVQIWIFLGGWVGSCVSNLEQWPLHLLPMPNSHATFQRVLAGTFATSEAWCRIASGVEPSLRAGGNWELYGKDRRTSATQKLD